MRISAGTNIFGHAKRSPARWHCDASPARWERLGLEIKPWRKDGSHILICPPDEIYGQLWGLDPLKWLEDVLATLTSVTGRDRIIRDRSKAKSATEPFAAALKGAWALVTCTSNAAVEALLAGVPVFVQGTAAPGAVSS